MRQFYAATTPRPIEARGNLADYERATIKIFDRVAPSVVQVVGRSGNDQLSAAVDTSRATENRSVDAYV